MKIEFWVIGKTSFAYLSEGMQLYEKRIKRYLPFETVIIPDVKNAKNLSSKELKKKEGQAVLKKLDKGDFLILLDEKGKAYTSVKFSKWLEQKLQLSNKKIIFMVGGAFGFSEEIYERANGKVTLSEMTFSHQMIRLFFLEQIYRALTIMKNEPYHNE